MGVCVRTIFSESRERLFYIIGYYIGVIWHLLYDHCDQPT